MDVTEQALSFLFEPVVLDSAATLADVLGLLQRVPALQTVFRHQFAKELVAELPPAEPAPGLSTPARSMEWLELRHCWQFDSRTKTCVHPRELQLVGIGWPQPDDVWEGNTLLHRRGERIEWSLSLSSVRGLLHLPVRVARAAFVYESARAAKRHGQLLRTEEPPDLTLGNLLHSSCWNLTWHGSPEATEKVAAELRQRTDALRPEDLHSPQGPRTWYTLDEVLARLGLPSRESQLRALFSSIDAALLDAAEEAILAVEDDDAAWPELQKRLGPGAVLKAELRALSGIELREAWHAAGKL